MSRIVLDTKSMSALRREGWALVAKSPSVRQFTPGEHYQVVGSPMRVKVVDCMKEKTCSIYEIEVAK